MEQYLIYLRKSRADRDAEARCGGDTLKRHRAALLGLARQRGLYIAGIYEEVVSGESIAARPEMRKLLAEVESGAYAGVLVMEVERLARGNTRDQGTVAETFQYSGTKIITPAKSYDPEEEADQEYFEFGLFMSRREYKAINRRLQRGRAASLREGKYIAGTAPYGYIRVKIPGQKGYTLEIVPEKAEVVRYIFSLYVNGERLPDGNIRQYGSGSIAGRLDAEGVPSPGGGGWRPCTVGDMLVNPTYAGMLRWSHRPTVRKMEHGKIVTVRSINRRMALLPGIHPPIVDRETWDAAQAVRARRSHPPVPGGREMVNPLSGLVRCALCGRSMERRKYRRGRDMLVCPGKGCGNMGAVLEEVECGILDALRHWLAGYHIEQAPGRASALADTAAAQQERAAARLSCALSSLRSQRDGLFDLLEQGVYTKEVFLARSRVLAEKTANTENALAEAQKRLKAEIKLSAAQRQVIFPAGHILDLYPLLETPREKNRLLKEFLEKAEYTRTGGRGAGAEIRLAVFPKVMPAPDERAP